MNTFRLQGFVMLFVVFMASPVFAQNLVLYAAVSTTNAMEEVISLYEKKGLGKITASFGATSTLARQLERGAPADLFLSADETWMDYLEERKLIREDTRMTLLTNTLVIVAPSGSDYDIKIEPGFALAASLNGGRLAVGDPDHTAVGIYFKEAMENLGVWSDIEPRLARANSVRAGTAMVERGEVRAGVVFGTEGGISEKIRVVATFPADTHAPITYPFAITSASKGDAAQTFVAFMKEPEVADIFRKWGFVPQ